MTGTTCGGLEVSIQVLFLHNAKIPHGFVIFSVLVGVVHGTLSLCLVLRECVQDEWAVQDLQQGTALLPGVQLSAGTMQLSSVAPASSTLGGSSMPPVTLGRSLASPGPAPVAPDRGAAGRTGERSARGACADREKVIPDLL